MKNFAFFVCIFLFSISPALAQLSDDFSDGDFTQNPTWQGNTTLFTVTDGQLQLNDMNPGSSNTAQLHLIAPTQINQPTTWEINISLAFAPSASNFAKVYLTSSESDLTGPLDGYFLKIGGISGSDDAVELFRQDGNSETLLLSGQVGGAGSNPVTTNIRVNRGTDGNWTLSVDYSGENNYINEGSTIDETHKEGAFFGIVCQYTSTRNSAFSFDDVFIDPIAVDETAPKFVDIQIIDNLNLSLEFDEPLLESSLNPNQFSIDNGIGMPAQANLDSENPAIVELTLTNPLQNLTSYTLTYSGLSDLNGNITEGSQSIDFDFAEIGEPAPGDLLISEIFADPTPPVNLPDFEFIEIYNNSNKVFDLSAIEFSSGSTPRAINSFTLLPNEYVIICDEDAAVAFESFGAVATMASFPALTNGGDDLSLFDQAGNLLFEVNYEDTWYKDSEKENGGYTLELVKLDGPINCSNNWYASQANNGGTPGQVNSWNGLSPDDMGPELLAAVPINPDEIVLTFNEPLAPGALLPSNFSVSTIDILEVTSASADFSVISILLNSDLQLGTVYTITANSTLTDCLGNSIGSPQSIITGLSEAARSR